MVEADRPMRLLFLIRSLGHGGAERQLVTLSRALPSSHFHVTIATFYAGGALEPELGGSSVNLRHLGKRGRWDVVGFGSRLTRFVRAARPDVIHGYMPTSNLLASLARRAVPKARLVWGIRASGLDWTHYDWLARREFEATRFLAGGVDLIIANSFEGARWHRDQGYPTGRMVVIPNGVDIDRFRPDAMSRAKTRAAWGIADDAFVVGLVGRLDPMKDHVTFLRAATRFAAIVPEACFVCVGAGPEQYADELRRLGEALGLGARLQWRPPTANVEDSYRGLDVLTSASAFGEGFSNVIGEAMACEVPCVVTDCGDASRIVGDTGAVVPVGAVERLAEAWHDIHQMDRRRLGSAGRERIAAEFSVERLVERTGRALQSLAIDEDAGSPAPWAARA